MFTIMTANSFEQLADQYCNIASQYCNIARKRTSGLALTMFLATFMHHINLELVQKFDKSLILFDWTVTANQYLFIRFIFTSFSCL